MNDKKGWECLKTIWYWECDVTKNNKTYKFEWRTGADWGGRSRLNGKFEFVLDGVFTNWGCLVILPGTSNPLLLLEGVGTTPCLSPFLMNGFMGLFYLLYM